MKKSLLPIPEEDFDFEESLIFKKAEVLTKGEDAIFYKLPLKSSLYFLLDSKGKNEQFPHLRIYRDQEKSNLLFNGLTPTDFVFSELLILHLSPDFWVMNNEI